MKYIVVNMNTKEQIVTSNRAEGRALAEYLSMTTPHLWYLMMVTE